MSLSNSRLAYNDCFDLLDRALDDPRGIRVELADENSAVYLRMRIHHARSIDRADNEKTYEPDHPLHGRSPYDILVCRIDSASDPVWLYLDKQKVEIGRIEPIPEGTLIEHRPMLQLEGPKPVVGEALSSVPTPALVLRRR